MEERDVLSYRPFAQSAGYYDAVYDYKDYGGEARRLHEVIQTRRPGARSLLDVACGSGRHAEHLSAFYEVTGVDIDPDLLVLARVRAPAARFELADMVELDLGQRFDVITCLFSSIGYVKTLPRVRAAAARMARHLTPGGVVIIEPWISPDDWIDDHLHMTTVDQPELKLARMGSGTSRGRLSIVEMHYLAVSARRGVERWSELHEVGLFTPAEYQAALSDAGLRAEFEPHGLVGRGLAIGVAAPAPSASV